MFEVEERKERKKKRRRSRRRKKRRRRGVSGRSPGASLELTENSKLFVSVVYLSFSIARQDWPINHEGSS